MRVSSFKALVEEVRPGVEQRLRRHLDATVDDWRAHGQVTVDLLEAVRDLSLRGGKRVRQAPRAAPVPGSRS